MIVRMTNPAAVELPAVKRLFLAALEHGSLNPEHQARVIASWCQDPRVGIWFAMENGEPKAFAVVKLPVDPRMDRPMFDLVANVGSAALSDELLKVALEFARSAGYDKVYAVNQTGFPDKVYMRRWRQLGHKSRHWASIIEIDLTKEEPGNGRISGIGPAERIE